ncbi:hypothetical protein EYF80_018030 [Liparis tanakae]|uniref:Uncharacterized protein n=1 Tax=Liparis tanakae TaxID=230148 RepID=A0A4Z2I0P2_9TELE|nr:hypothetical protein EYF80_018030 [Liparis tanakae]
MKELSKALEVLEKRVLTWLVFEGVARDASVTLVRRTPLKGQRVQAGVGDEQPSGGEAGPAVIHGVEGQHSEGVVDVGRQLEVRRRLGAGDLAPGQSGGRAALEEKQRGVTASARSYSERIWRGHATRRWSQKKRGYLSVSDHTQLPVAALCPALCDAHAEAASCK